MDAATAETRLKKMTAWDKSPALTQADITALLAMHSRASTDEAGAAITIYDLAAAAVEGWRWKMAAAASEINFTSDGQTISRAQYFEHCERMIQQYGGSAAFSLETSPRFER